MFNYKILTGVAIAATCLFSSCVDLDQDPLGPVSYTHLTLPTNREV